MRIAVRAYAELHLSWSWVQSLKPTLHDPMLINFTGHCALVSHIPLMCAWVSVIDPPLYASLTQDRQPRTYGLHLAAPDWLIWSLRLVDIARVIEGEALEAAQEAATKL